VTGLLVESAGKNSDTTKKDSLFEQYKLSGMDCLLIGFMYGRAGYKLPGSEVEFGAAG